MFLTLITFISAIAISLIAAGYSILGLASLFAGAIARNDRLSTLYQNKATVQLAVAKAQDSQAQTNRRVDVNRYRNRRNSGSLGTVKATVSS